MPNDLSVEPTPGAVGMEDYAAFFRLAADGLCLAAADGRIRAVNPALAAMLGLRREELVERSLPDLLHPDDRLHCTAALAVLSDGGKPQSFECRCPGNDGGWKSIHWTLATEAPETVYGFARDVTASRRHDELREGLLRRYRTIVEAAPFAVLMVSGQGLVVQANKAAETLFRFEPGALLNQPVDVLVPQERRGAHARMRTDYVTGVAPRQMGAGRDLFGVTADGSRVPVEIGLVPFQSGGAPFTLVFALDISARKRLEAERELLLLQSAGDSR